MICKHCAANAIVLHLPDLKMLVTIDFDDKPCRVLDKVQIIAPKRCLPSKVKAATA